MSCYKCIHPVTKISSNPKDIKVIYKVVKTQCAVKKVGWAENKGKKYKVKLRNASISMLPQVSPPFFCFPHVHLDSNVFVSRALFDKVATLYMNEKCFKLQVWGFKLWMWGVKFLSEQRLLWMKNAWSCECEGSSEV
jgi:hypothetical protein